MHGFQIIRILVSSVESGLYTKKFYRRGFIIRSKKARETWNIIFRNRKRFWIIQDMDIHPEIPAAGR